MRSRLLVTLLLLTLSAQSQVPRMIPDENMGPLPGTRELQLPPGRQTGAQDAGPAVDVKQLQKDAKELAALSASINADMDYVNKGLLPKDMVEKLKRVEKLSKHLRSQLTQ
ncbi:MAG TPA: hypothetical protein VGF06_07320 [Terriglobales bacterium]|jgi:hypothetical protein